MQQTLEPVLEVVATAKSRFERNSARLLYVFSFVPDNKLMWTPSATAKSSVRIVAHCGLTSKFFTSLITNSMTGTMPSPVEFFKDLHAAGEKFTTRESVVALVDETTAKLLGAFDAVNAATINSTPNSPFGALPMEFWMSQCSDHMAGDIGQLEYLQTIWGDLDNHMG